MLWTLLQEFKENFQLFENYLRVSYKSYLKVICELVKNF